jgi:hypothetical protein
MSAEEKVRAAITERFNALIDGLCVGFVDSGSFVSGSLVRQGLQLQNDSSSDVNFRSLPHLYLSHALVHRSGNEALTGPLDLRGAEVARSSSGTAGKSGRRT